MKTTPRFWRWILVFGALGLLVPVVLTLWWHFAPYGAGREAVLWPSSIMFMAFDSPQPAPTSTIVSVYAVALIENCLLYAVIGAILWPITHFISRRRSQSQRIISRK